MTMKCSHCGADVVEGKCDYCGTVYYKSEENINNQQRVRKFVKIVWRKLTISTRIALAFWLLCCIYNFSDIKNTGVLGYIGVSLFGFLFFGTIVQIISIKKRKLTPPSKTTFSTNRNTTESNFSPIKEYDKMEGHEFEYFCGDILSKSGFENVEITKGSGDQGIDIIATKDGIKYGIQCKCYSSNIGNKAVQEAFAGKTFYGCHVSAVLTNQYFTKSAQELAKRNGVLLWDRDRLDQFINYHN